MRAAPTESSRIWRIDTFRRATDETLEVAKAYLEAEEWDLDDALASYRADQQRALAADRVRFAG